MANLLQPEGRAGDLNIIVEDLFYDLIVAWAAKRNGFLRNEDFQFAFTLTMRASIALTWHQTSQTLTGFTWYKHSSLMKQWNRRSSTRWEYLARYTNRSIRLRWPTCASVHRLASVSFMAIKLRCKTCLLDGSASDELGGNWSCYTADQWPGHELILLDFTTIYRRKQRLLKKKLRSKKNLPPTNIVVVRI